MIKSYLTYISLFLFLCISCKENTEQKSTEFFENKNTIVGEVVGISDGDSFKIKLSDNEVIRVRLAYVDCPERGQDFYQKAKNFSSDQIFKKSVRVEVTDTDRYKRKVGWLYYDDKILNEELLRKGFAWHYARYSNDARLKQLEQEARLKKIGIWSIKNQMPPWEFRRKQRD